MIRITYLTCNKITVTQALILTTQKHTHWIIWGPTIILILLQCFPSPMPAITCNRV